MAGEDLAVAARAVARMPSMLYWGLRAVRVLGGRRWGGFWKGWGEGGRGTYDADGWDAVFALGGFAEHDVCSVVLEVVLYFLGGRHCGGEKQVLRFQAF